LAKARVKGAVATLAIYKGVDGQRHALVNQNALDGAVILMELKSARIFLPAML
jgi:hypothetical protein